MGEGNWVPPTPHEEDSGPFTPKEHLGPGTQLPQDPKGVFVSSDAPRNVPGPPDPLPAGLRPCWPRCSGTYLAGKVVLA